MIRMDVGDIAGVTEDVNAEADIRAGLKEMDFSPLIGHLEPALANIYRHDKKRAQFIANSIATLNNLKQNQRLTLLMVLMTDIIRTLTVQDSAFFDCSNFPWISDVEKLYDEVVDEVDVALNNSDAIPAFQDIQKEQREVTGDDKWKVLLFKGYGESVDKNLALFPKTSRLLDKIPGWTTGMFSILLPEKKIPPHVGPYAGVLRYHLGLKVPDDCGINVKGEERLWEEGKSLVFDDSFEHFAWNNSKQKRVVLFVDFLRPLPFPINLLNEWVVLDVINESDFIRGLVNNLYKYDSLHEALN